MFPRALLAWFTDDDDPLWTPWRGALLWVLVVAVLAGVGYTATRVGWDNSHDNHCPASQQATGGC